MSHIHLHRDQVDLESHLLSYDNVEAFLQQELAMSMLFAYEDSMFVEVEYFL